MDSEASARCVALRHDVYASVQISHSIFISDVAFTNRQEEQAHFDAMNARLQSLTSVHRDLGGALVTLQALYTLLGKQVVQLESYIANLAPEPPLAQVQTVPSSNQGTSPNPRTPPELGVVPQNRKRRKLGKYVRAKFFVRIPNSSKVAYNS